MSSTETPADDRPFVTLHVYRDDEGAACAYADIPEDAATGRVWHHIPFGTPLDEAEREATLLAGRLGLALEWRDPLRLHTGVAVGDLGVMHPQDLNASNDD